MIRPTLTPLMLSAALFAQAGQATPPRTLQPTLPQQGQDPQNPNQTRQQPLTPEQQIKRELEQRRATDPALDNVIPIWRQAPQAGSFQGFPIFPSQLPGYGRYPRGLGQVLSDVNVGELPLLPTAPAPPETGWPQWLKNESRAPLPYQADKALLVRNVDRVWLRVPDEEAFVPLYFYDKLRAIGKGTEIEVRQVGEFELLLFGGSRVVAQGVTTLRVDELGEAVVAISLDRLTRLRLEAFGREHRIALPDGSMVVLTPKERPKEDAPAPEPAEGLAGFLQAAATTPFQPGLLVFERQDEPGWRSGRATLWNGGKLPVQWQHGFGTTEIAPGQRVTFFLSPPATAVPARLTSAQVSVESVGNAVRCEAVESGEVTWSGARFRLAKGAVLRLDPVLGVPFAAKTGQ